MMITQNDTQITVDNTTAIQAGLYIGVRHEQQMTIQPIWPTESSIESEREVLEQTQRVTNTTTVFQVSSHYG